MIAVDTNILVYAHREDFPWHAAAYRRLRELAEGKAPWAIPWNCVHEFLAVVTHPRIFRPPSSVPRALEQVEAWTASPSLHLIGEMPGYWTVLRGAVTAGRIDGARIHEVRIAALCRQHRVTELWSADRDLTRFAGLKVVKPRVARLSQAASATARKPVGSLRARPSVTRIHDPASSRCHMPVKPKPLDGALVQHAPW